MRFRRGRRCGGDGRSAGGGAGATGHLDVGDDVLLPGNSNGHSADHRRRVCLTFENRSVCEAREDLVVSDIMMPGGVGGLQLAREIRRRHPAMPSILTTGYVEAAIDMKDGEFDLC